MDLPKGYTAADPFLYRRDGEIFVFFELMDQKKCKAVIGYKMLYPIEGDVGIAYEFEGHCSYPCLFEHNNNLYMIPETTYSNDINILECYSFPDKWISRGKLLENIIAPDTTAFLHSKDVEVFVYQRHKNKSINELFLGSIDFENYKIVNLKKVKQYMENTGRPGGGVLLLNEENIRVAQSALKFYGEKLEFYKFEWDGVNYHENKVSEMTTDNIKINDKEKYIGVHTYNKCGDVEVIDLYTKADFKLFRPIEVLLRRVGLFGYGLYDIKEKRINTLRRNK